MTTCLSVLLRLITAAALVLGLSLAAFAGEPAGAPDAATMAARAALKAAPAPGTSGLGLIANHGQWAPEVLYMAPIKGGRAWVTASSIVYDFTKATKPKRGKPGERGAQPPSLKDGPKAAKARQAERVQGHVVRLSFAGALQPAVWPSGKLNTRLNYLLGNDSSKHAKNVPAYAAVSLDGLWPGVDLRLAQGPGGLDLSFNAVDAAALTKARVAVEGASVLTGVGEGAVVATSLGQRSLGAVAVSFDSTRYAGQVSGGTVALAPGRAAPTQAAAATERSRGLVYSTFLGGDIDDYGGGLAVDTSGAAYVTGYAGSSDFPTTPGAYDRTFNGVGDAFVTKLSADGSALVYSTFIGGDSYDSGNALAVDASGVVHVTGSTWSSNFPTTPGAYDSSLSGTDAFVAKLSADGSALIYSTFLGGDEDDTGNALAVGASGAVYVTGLTWSLTFPTTPGAFDTTFNDSNGAFDAFVTKLSADGSVLVYSTFLGGSDLDYGESLAIDASEAAYVAGTTLSSNFPSTPGAHDTDHNGLSDVFVSKLSADGSALIYSTFLGGGGDDQGYGLAVDANGAAHVTGKTWSSNFPTTPEAYDRIFNDYGDAFVTKLSADGSALVYSTFLGGASEDSGSGLAAGADGAVYVTGETLSADFPTTPGAPDTTYNGGYRDAFVSKLSADGSALAHSTFLGGSDRDYGLGLAVGASGAAYVMGSTTSSDFPTTPGAFDTTYGGVGDAFVTKLDIGGVTSGVALNAAVSPTTVAAGGSFTVNYTVSNNTDNPVTGDLGFTAVRSGNLVGHGRILTDTTVAAHGAISGTFTQRVPASTAPGVYTYTLRIGQFPNRAVDKVSFKATVTAPAQAGVGASAWQAVHAKR